MRRPSPDYRQKGKPKGETTMNRREMFAALAATAVAGDVLAFAEANPQTAPAAAPAPAAPPAETPVMGSKVFDWNAMVDKPTRPVRCGLFAARRRRRWKSRDPHLDAEPGADVASAAQAPERRADYRAAGHGGDAFERGVDSGGAGERDLQRIEPAAWIQECGNGAGDLSRGEREDGSDAAGEDGVCGGIGQGPSERAGAVIWRGSRAVPPRHPAERTWPLCGMRYDYVDRF